MPKLSSWQHAFFTYFCILGAGWMFHLSLAPFHYWPVGILSATVLALSLKSTTGRQGLWRSFVFGTAMFGAGVSWIYVSIHDFASTPAPLAVIMTSIFVLFLAAVFALPFYVYCRFMAHTRFGFTLGFATIWIVSEWIRSWLLTGFPWLYLGYGHIQTPLAGWAPISGVLGIGFFAVLSGNILADVGVKIVTFKKAKPSFYALACVSLIWGTGFLLQKIQWTSLQAEPITAAIIQPNIPLPMKWDPQFAPEITQILQEQTNKHWNHDLIILPENAVPYFYNQAEALLAQFNQKGLSTQSSLITGILYDHDFYTFYNSIIGLGEAQGMYHKQRLVPFGEYVPLEKYLRGIITLFNLPTSIIQVGPNDSSGLTAQKKDGQSYGIAPLICYEVVYPDLVRKLAKNNQLLITISNDAWFGESIGPLQHVQMAQMRALENQKYLIRGTNTGISGIINTQGEIVVQGQQFIREEITGKALLANGSTPFTRLGAWPLLLLSFTFICVCIVRTKTNTARSYAQHSNTIDD